MRRTFAAGGALLAVLGGAALTPPLASAALRAGPAVVQVSADPYRNAAADHATEVEPDTVAAGRGSAGRWRCWPPRPAAGW